VLLLKRAEESQAGGAWCLPGGKVDYGETVEEAVARELMEETGLRLLSCRFLFYQDSPPDLEGGMHCINLYFECEAEGDVTLNAESVESTWVDRADAVRYEIVFRNGGGLRRYWERRE
jgi:ADP-ribose pyrophosphatase YjhB (NUDIX family)